MSFLKILVVSRVVSVVVVIETLIIKNITDDHNTINKPQPFLI